MRKNPTQLGDESLAEAFSRLLHQAIALQEAGGSPHHAQPVAEFSYLLTPKQLERIRRICRQMNWPVPQCRGIRIDLQAILHPLHARETKDRCTPQETLQIMINAYSAYSQVGLNKPKHGQGILFNTGRKVRIGKGRYYAVAVVRICSAEGKTYLAPVTAYHATEAKIRNIS